MQAGRPYTRIKGDSLPGAIAPLSPNLRQSLIKRAIA